jgi:hypothetical protein
MTSSPGEQSTSDAIDRPALSAAFAGSSSDRDPLKPREAGSRSARAGNRQRLRARDRRAAAASSVAAIAPSHVAGRPAFV